MAKRIHIVFIAVLVLVQGFAMSFHVAVDHAKTAHHYFFHHDAAEIANINPTNEHTHSHGEHSHSHPHEEMTNESATEPHCALESGHDDNHHRHNHGHGDSDHPVVLIRPDFTKHLNHAIASAPLELVYVSGATFDYADEQHTFSSFDAVPSFKRGPPSA